MTVLWALLACSGGHGEGTAVGNPGSSGSLDVVVTDAAEGLSLDVADAAIDGVSLLDCEGGEVWVEVDQVLDALPGSADGFAIDGGSWCGLVLSYSTELDPLFFEGSTSGGTRFHVALDLGPLTLQDRFSVDGDALLLQISLDGALDPDALEAAGEEVEIGAEDAQAQAWAGAVAEGSQLWVDLDEDVAIGPDDERADSQGYASAMDSESAGCGCAGASGGGGWGLLLALAMIGRRRAQSAV